jgi:hypothetical protein
VAGTPVTVAAGPPSPASCATALTLPAGQVLISETLPTGTAMTAVSTLPSAGLLTASNLAAGTATVTVIAGAQTIATFTDSVTPTTGFLQICKVGGTGVRVGRNFTFSVAGTPIIVPAGLAPGGSCSTPLVLPAGPATVTETLPIGLQLTDVTTTPFASLVSSDLSAGQVTVTIPAGGQTVVTFSNARIPIPTTGFLQICKVAGAGIVTGTNFVFMVAGTPVTVPAGPPPQGSCGAAFARAAGPVVVTETLLSGTVLAAVTSLPSGTLIGSNLAAGAANVVVQNGGQTIVTFVDAIPGGPPSTGFLQICKVAGAGIAVGTNFTFTVGGTPLTVAAGPAPGGSCSASLVMPVGATLITETPSSGTALSSVSTLPAGMLVSSNQTAGAATVTVNSGTQTIATFLNTIVSDIPLGTLEICKLSGSGVAPGMSFSFDAGGTPVTVAAGSCVSAATFPVGSSIVVSETPSAGTTVSAISVLPPDRLGVVDLSGGTATITIGTGLTEVDFTNTAGGLGLLKVCKIAGSGITPGARFSFAMGATSFVVPAGYCVQSGLFPLGTVITVTEVSSPAAVASAISVLPADRQGTVDLSAQSITATVGVGVTEIYFTNVGR